MKQLKLLLLVLLPLLIGSGCKNEEEGHDTKLVTNLEGSMVFMSTYDTWAIQIAEPGTIDVVDYYLIKQVDKNYQQQGMNVVFSGNVYQADDIKPEIGGAKYYYVELIKIKQNE